MKDKNSKRKVLRFALSFCVLIFTFCIFVRSADAATLYFSPSSGAYAVGRTFSVGVYVSSADQAMNAASGVVSFPSDKLKVVSLSKAGSVFSLWVQEPSFSNGAGTVNFEGVVLNPGFTGAGGKVITITFRADAGSDAPLSFSSGSVLANDGKGTNILTGMGDADFSIGGAPPAPEAFTPPEVTGTPAAPEISSPTHPDPDKWYAQNTAKFVWNLPRDVTAARLSMGRIPNAIPDVTYIPPIGSKEIENLADGIWYFSVRLKNGAGWGGISHFRFQIDTQKPSSFDITEITREDLTKPKARFVFNAQDDTSGIDHYEVQIDGGNPQTWQDDGSHKYETPVSEPGKHILIAKAVDKAGNFLANSAEFTVEPLESPVITDYPRTLLSGEALVVKGRTRYPGADAIVWLQKENEEAKSQNVKTDDNGNFVFVAGEKLDSGIYKLWAEATDARGAKSLPSDKVTVSVEQPAFLRIGSLAIGFLAVAIPLAALIFAILFMAWYGWHKFVSFRKKIRGEIRETESALHKAFDLLKEDIRGQIKLLEKAGSKRQLTEEEEKIFRQLKKDLDEAEKLIRRELEDIEKEVR